MGSKNKVFNEKFVKGFSLLELIVVIAIISLISAVAIISYSGYQEKSNSEVCKYNRTILTNEYKIYLILENKENSDIVFNGFIVGKKNQICPKGGEISYLNGGIICSYHNENYNEDKTSDYENSYVPFLHGNKSITFLLG